MKQKRKYIVCVFLVVVILFPLLALAGDNSEGINEAWLETVLSIEVVDESGIGTPIGSGFLIKTPNNHMVLVTAKHVIRGTNNRIRPNLAYRFNKKNGESFLVADKLLQENTGDWFVSKC